MRFGAMLLVIALPLAGQTAQVALETEKGRIVVDVDTVNAPVTARNFLKYVENGFYDGGAFHRTVKMNNQPQNRIRIEVVQGGINPERKGEGFAPIALESTLKTGLKHLDGVISMARSEPNSATSDFFICIGAQPSLDFGGMRNPDGQGFAAFGRVLEGLDVVKRIQAAPAEGQALKPAVRILKARRLR